MGFFWYNGVMLYLDAIMSVFWEVCAGIIPLIIPVFAVYFVIRFIYKSIK